MLHPVKPLALVLVTLVSVACGQKRQEPKPWHHDPVLVDRVLKTALEAGHMAEASLNAFTISVWQGGGDFLVLVERERPDGQRSTQLFRYLGAIGLQASGERLEGEAGSSHAHLAGRDFDRVYVATGFKSQRSPQVPMP